MKYDEGVEIKIVTNSDTAKEILLPLLEQLKIMGGIGASRSIKIEDWNDREEDWATNSFYMDGDGHHGINKILLDNEEYKGEKKMKKAKAGSIEHKTAPKEYRKEGATKRSDYADPKRYKYPLHTEANARSALQYFSKPKNRSGYSAGEVKTVARRIIKVCKKYGIEVSEATYKTFGLEKSQTVSLKQALHLRRKR